MSDFRLVKLTIWIFQWGHQLWQLLPTGDGVVWGHNPKSTPLRGLSQSPGVIEQSISTGTLLFPRTLVGQPGPILGLEGLNIGSIPHDAIQHQGAGGDGVEGIWKQRKICYVHFVMPISQGPKGQIKAFININWK
jgi:hypothetical protein